MALDLILRWGHILPAMILAGGLIMLGMVWLPGVRRRGEDLETAISIWIPGWPRIVGGCTFFLLVTGVLNFLRKIQQPGIESNYHMVFGVKFLLGMALFFLAAILVGRTSLAKKLRLKGSFWFPVAAWLGIVIVLIGGYMRAISM